MKHFDGVNVFKNLLLLAFAMLLFTACTDYAEDYENLYGWLEDAPYSSSVKVEDAGSKYDPKTNTLKDLRDNQTYKTVSIGNQIWMAENLNYDYNKGTAKSYCYSNYPSNCETYGRLYLWSAAMDSAGVFSNDGKGCGYGYECKTSKTIRGVCPEGWHLPSEAEWEELFTAVGGREIAGKMLKNTIGWSSDNGTDAYGFSAMPAGFWNFVGNFFDVGEDAYFWSSTEYYNYDAYGMWLYDGNGASLGDRDKDDGFSVRCIQDSNESSINPDPDQESSSSEISSSSAKSSSSVNSDFDSKSCSSVALSSSSSLKVEDPGCEYDPVAKTLKDLRDGQTYKTVKIGTQTWMVENLNYNYNVGTAKSYCYNDSIKYCETYGRLYLWSAVMDSAGVFSNDGKGCGESKECEHSERVRGVCPKGWHLPSDDDWEELFTAVDGREVAGKALKAESDLWYTYADYTAGTDAYDFSALPAGYRNSYGNFYGVGYVVNFWSSSEYDSDGAYYMGLFHSGENAYLNYYSKNYAQSVRCLQD